MMQHLIQKKVEVITGDMTYEGVLIEIGESEVQLQGRTGWIVVPLEKVLHIREVDQDE
jgi:hypothetical protein